MNTKGIDYNELYALFSRVTPLTEDCGRLCGGACCRDDADPEGGAAGMRLFPGEEAPPRAAGNGRVLPAAQGGGTVRLFVCDGSCDRERRPLACRIFPLFPYRAKSGRLRVIYDPRAFRLCPLVRCRAHVRLRRDFVRAVAGVGRRLLRDEAGRAFLAAESREIDEWATLSAGLSAGLTASSGQATLGLPPSAKRRQSYRRAQQWAPPARRTRRRISR